MSDYTAGDPLDGTELMLGGTDREVTLTLAAYERGRAEVLQGECFWSLADEDASMWESSCGKAWSFIDDGPTENGVVFCMKCGKRVVLDAQKDGGQ